MDKENKNFTKNEERSFVISMVLTLQMDRKVEKKHYIIPGSYELSWKDEYIPFDFFASNINFIENDLISFSVDNIDTTAFPGTNQKLTKDFLQNCSISECYIYTGESEVEPEIHPVKICGWTFLFSDGTTITLSRSVLSEYHFD